MMTLKRFDEITRPIAWLLSRWSLRRIHQIYWHEPNLIKAHALSLFLLVLFVFFLPASFELWFLRRVVELTEVPDRRDD